MVANYPSTLPSSAPATHSNVTDEVRALASYSMPVFNVRMYGGAVGDGTTDDTTAIQNTITAAGNQTPGGAVVYFPPGTYKVSSTLTLPSSVTLQGAGFRASKINQTSTTADGFATSGAQREIAVRDLWLNGPGSGSGRGVALLATGSYAVFDCEFDHVYITNFGSHGFLSQDLCTSTLNHVRVDTCGVGASGGNGFEITDNGTSQLGGTSLTFTGCYANNCGPSGTGYGFNVKYLKYSVFNGCATDSCDIGYRISQSTGLSFNGCGCEATTVSPGHGWYIRDGSTSITVNAAWCTNIATTGIGFRVGADGGTNCSRILFNTCRVQGTVVPSFSAQVDANSQATFVAFQRHPSAANATTGTITYIADENTGDFNLAGNFQIGVVGKGLQIKAGTNGRIGTASLTAGTVTIANTSVTANTTVLAMTYNISGTPGFLAMSGRVAGTSFTITSYTGAGAVNTADTSSFTWMLVERT